jgi:distribution and morphology protein 31
MLAYQISQYLTRETGVHITFQTAIVPNWKDNTIQFKNVKVTETIKS